MTFGKVIQPVLYPALGAAAFALALLGFINGHDLHLGSFRVYGVSTDVMPHKETLFFVALAFFGTGAAWFTTIVFARLSGAWLAQKARELVKRPWFVVGVLAAFAFVATALVSWLSLQHTTVVLDEDMYRFQVDLLRDGVLYTKLPNPLEPFREFYSVQAKGIWTGIYPWGHIAALVPGYVVGWPQLVPHLCAAAAVVLTYLVGREVFPDDEVSPLIGAAVVALSPFVAFTCASTHNSTTSLVLVNIGLLGLARGIRRGSVLFALIAGFAFGVGLHSRPLNAVAVAAPAGFFALIVALKLRRPVFKLAMAFFFGLLPGILVYFAINEHITGDRMVTAVQMSHPTNLRIFGFDNTPVPHTPLLAFGKQGTNLIRTMLWTSGSLFAALAILGFIGGLRRRTADLLLLVPVASIFGCYYFFYTSPGSDTGPLYYLDMVPILGIIVGRALVALGERLSETKSVTADSYLRYASAAFLASAVVAFVTFWPMQGIAGRTVTDNNLLPKRAVAKAGIHKAVVFYNRNPNNKSWNLTPPPPKPDFSDDILYARNQDDISAYRLWLKLGQSRSFYTLVFEEEVVTVEPWYPPAVPPTFQPRF